MSSDSDDESYIVNAERKAKQNYLFEEIIENNYDPKLFTLFCEKTKPPDLDNWSFDELVECVAKFKMEYRRGQTFEDVMGVKNGGSGSNGKEDLQGGSKNVVEDVNGKKGSNDESKKITKADSSSFNPNPSASHPANTFQKLKSKEDPLSQIQTRPKSNTVPNKSSQNLPDSDSQSSCLYTIRCRTLEPSSISQVSNLEFTLGEPISKDGGFLTPNYYIYPITIPSLQWSCERKYSDFLWLNESLNQIFIGHFIPPLSQIPSLSIPKSEAELVPKRLFQINEFLSWLCRSPLLLSHPYTENFFRITNQVDFSKYIKTQKKRTKIESIEMYFSSNGYLTCNLSDLSEKFEDLSKFIVSSENVSKTIRSQCSEVMKNLNNIEDDYRSISKSLEELENFQESFPAFAGNAEVFKEFKQKFVRLADLEGTNCNNFEEHFRWYFSYRHLEKCCLKDLIKSKELAYQEFRKSEIKPKPGDKAKDFFGFLNNQTFTETVRVLSEENSINRKNFLAFARKSSKIVSNTQAILSEVQVNP